MSLIILYSMAFSTRLPACVSLLHYHPAKKTTASMLTAFKAKLGICTKNFLASQMRVQNPTSKPFGTKTCLNAKIFMFCAVRKISCIKRWWKVVFAEQQDSTENAVEASSSLTRAAVYSIAAMLASPSIPIQNTLACNYNKYSAILPTLDRQCFPPTRPRATICAFWQLLWIWD